MYNNVPDDWNRYYYTCSLCGQKYHASEGGCQCASDLICSCGSCNWKGPDYEEDMHCADCFSGPLVITSETTTAHKAKTDHKDGSVKTGEHYRVNATIGYFPGGRMYRSFSKKVVSESEFERIKSSKNKRSNLDMRWLIGRGFR